MGKDVVICRTRGKVEKKNYYVCLNLKVLTYEQSRKII